MIRTIETSYCKAFELCVGDVFYFTQGGDTAIGRDERLYTVIKEEQGLPKGYVTVTYGYDVDYYDSKKTKPLIIDVPLHVDVEVLHTERGY
jgi:hypothetical protein